MSSSSRHLGRTAFDSGHFGNSQHKSSVRAARVDGQFAAMSSGDPDGDTEAKTGAFADVLRREEWLEDLFSDLRRNALSTIRYGDQDIAAGLHPFDANPLLVGIPNRVTSIRNEIKNDLRDLNVATGNRELGLSWGQAHLDSVVLDFFRAERKRAIDHVADSRGPKEVLA